MTGLKHDKGKPRPDLILRTMARAMLEVSKVAAFGAEKYADDNWLLVDDAKKRYADAKARHMLEGAIRDHDFESGLLHAAHEAWNALALLELKLRERAAPIVDKWPESADARIDAIGQKGNDGEHYKPEPQRGDKLSLEDLQRGGWFCIYSDNAVRFIIDAGLPTVFTEIVTSGGSVIVKETEESAVYNVKTFVISDAPLFKIELINGDFYYA